jgi:ABC-type bacteriocin/lantibiotic exporter with double-glycine peptidase domain
LQRGARIAVEGNSGAGKSRLLAAIAQASHDHSGTVTFDGKNLKTMSAKRRSSVIGFASVELPLLPGSLGMNLRYAKPGMSDDALIQLARQCGLGPLLSRLGGLDGKLRTPDLSSGERQALALARALAGTPPVLLLDAIDGRLDSGPLDWLRGQLAEYPGIVLFVSARAEMDALATGTWRLSGRQLRPGPPPPGSNILRFERPEG